VDPLAEQTPTGRPRQQQIKRQIVALSKERLNTQQHLLKLIVYASCSADHKTKNRWAQAFRYVRRRRKHKHTSQEQFDRLLYCNGGVAGCAGKIAAPRRRPSGEMRLGLGFDLLALREEG
jgi:hypothetical protein